MRRIALFVASSVAMYSSIANASDPQEPDSYENFTCRLTVTDSAGRKSWGTLYGDWKLLADGECYSNKVGSWKSCARRVVNEKTGIDSVVLELMRGSLKVVSGESSADYSGRVGLKDGTFNNRATLMSISGIRYKESASLRCAAYDGEDNPLESIKL